jgi:formylglycine-generating enzyme required for sulfatase activity
MTFTPDGNGIEVEFGSGGQVARVRSKTQVSYDDAVEQVHRLGLRLSTPDEWEYACGAGASTLFRWGDDTPDSGYPYDHRTGPHREPG